MKGKQIWTLQEDQLLKCLVFAEKEVGNWAIIAQKINKEFPQKSRSSKQCRERYVNYTSIPDKQHFANDWTAEETQTLFDLFQKMGSRWTKISQEIKGRSENCVKNRFYGSLRKALRKMNRAAKNLVKKFKKEVKYQSITRIIDASEGLFRLQSPLKEQSEELSRKILTLAKNIQEQMEPLEAQELIIEINKFNMATRSYKSKKKAKNSVCTGNQQEKVLKLVKKSTLDSSTQKTNENGSDEDGSMQDDQSSSNNAQNTHFNSEHVKKEEQSWSWKIQDGLIFYQQDGAVEKAKYNDLEDFENLLSQILSPLECEAWI